MRTEDLLAAIATGLWRWDRDSRMVALDAEAARLLGLPARPAVLPEAAVRSRCHPEDWVELTGIVTLAVAEGTLAEGRMRIIGEDGRVLRIVRSRCRPVHHGDDRQLFGTLEEVPEPQPGAAAPAVGVTGDWRRGREAFLLDAGRALAEARSTSEVLRVAATLSMPGFSPDGLAVFGVEADHLKVIGHHGYEEGDERPFVHMPLSTDYPAAEVVRTGRAVYLSSPEEYQRRFPATWPLAARFRRQSWAFLPLIEGGRTIGAWMAAFGQRVAFTPDERSILTTVARMLAQALARARAQESERELSLDLQRSMMPTLPPDIPGMTVAARYVPTGGGLRVGGDWYDMIPLPSGRIALVIGDVQGHDVRAAGLMGQLRIALRAFAAEGHHPDAVLSRASRFFAALVEQQGADGRGEPEARFATCLYMEVDPAAGTLEVARAGHPDIATRMTDGSLLTRPTEGGLPLGVAPESDYPTTRLTLEPGELMLVCTDGLIETGGHDLETGWQRLRTIIEDHADEPVETLADSLLQAVLGPSSYRTPGPLADRREDDIALLLLSRTEPAEVAAPPQRRTVLTVAQAEYDRLAVVRQHLRELLHDWAAGEQTDAAVVMANELITNVLVHTDEDALLSAQISGERGERRLRVEVADASDELPHRRHPGELASSGRGLLLMELLADAWGVAPRGDGKSLWFELYEGEPARTPAGRRRSGGPESRA